MTVSPTWLYAKAALTGLTRRGSSPADVRLPPEVKSTRALVDREHLAAYGRVCGFRVGDELPITYPHVLAFPAQLALLTGRGFPFPLPGLVHVANRVARTRPLLASEPLDLRVRLDDLRPHERGWQFDVVSTASVDGVEVWVDVSTYLRRERGAPGRGGGPVGGEGSGPGPERGGPPMPTAVWRVGGDVGRRYAAVSGDRNPIHLHAVPARVFGFRRAIAHGMWSKARCVAEFEGGLPDACAVDVRFKAPIPLPGQVDFSITRTGDGWRFSLWSRRPHLEGVVTG
ncbi:MaoC family dehydratase [Saccharothrix australiensis]|uniref:Acyl dehydratase n=1 Tax=Saccharothrix australiensis TaxID=2072 RepID=A0A495VQY1_9PSEU|nr:MaoC/PaaZ C-terminal domain-containing protein [Saccharothrix australiensis]RKT51692.1 acyl dehydratase [Saccharothrix australiensis]